jgi:hypothetical protein
MLGDRSMGRAPIVWFATLALVGLSAAGCGRASSATQRAGNEAQLAPRADCSHAFCSDHFFVDVDPGAPCASGATCTLGVKLTATGAFHVNDEYPFKFKADEASGPGVEFLGKSTEGKNVFSRQAGDWRKDTEQTGTMSVAWRVASGEAGSTGVGGTKKVAGLLKLSVCSAQACLLDQASVQTTVAAR